HSTRWLSLESDDFVADVPTALSALTSVLLFVPSLVRPGVYLSENHYNLSYGQKYYRMHLHIM
ncbi:3938_t:CDS:1, partial [Dentiscutata heterogama]